MSVVPSSLALASIVDDSEIVASDHRNNYAAIQTAVNALISALSGGSSGQVLTASDASDVQWGAARTTYRKASAKAVNTTTAATDLLNGEITLAAGVMGPTGVVRLSAWGDQMNNSGGGVTAPRFQIVLGGVTIFDTGALPVTFATSAFRSGWEIICKIANTGSANSQASSCLLQQSVGNGPSAPVTAGWVTGEGMIEIVSGYQIIHGQAVNPSTAVDTASACGLQLKVINGSASATYETKLLGAIVEVL
jgi:hypothetical protein